MDWVVSVLAGGIGAAAITGIFKLLEIWASLKADNTKAKQKAVEAKVEKNKDQLDTLTAAMRVILHDRIKYLIRRYSDEGKISYDDRRDILDMYSIYHDDLGGNGNLDALMKALDKIQVI